MREENTQIAQYLLQIPSFVYFNATHGCGTFGSLLHIAILKLQVDHVRVFMEHEVSPNIQDKITGDCPLHSLMIVYHKNPKQGKQILEILAEYQVDFNSYNKEKWTPLHLAVKRGNVEATRDLLEIGCF